MSELEEAAVLTVNMLEAKTNLSKLVEAVETRAVAEVVIARHGRPVARLVPIEPRRGQRIGIARGVLVVPETIDAKNATVEAQVRAYSDSILLV